MHRLIPQRLATWLCGRKGHRYIKLDQGLVVVGDAGDLPSYAQQLEDGVVVAVYTCRCGERQETRTYGGQFPRRKQ